MTARLRDGRPTDAVSIAQIYNHYILNTTVTFEEETVKADEIARRMSAIDEQRLPWLVAENSSGIQGYAYATRWRSRTAYRHSVEVTVYVDHQSVGIGLGTTLYQGLFQRLRHRQVQVAIGGITLPNEASIALHEKLGMRKVAHFEEVGFKFGRYLDVGYWQTTLMPVEEIAMDG